MAPTSVLNSNKNNEDQHLGHLLLQYLRDQPKDGICQIDASDDSKETFGSVLRRSIRLARALTRSGLAPGDTLALGGPNHLDLHIPYYAALFSGLPTVGLDPYYKFEEIKHFFNITKPRIAFCQEKSVPDFERAAEELGLDMKIVSFDGECNLKKFIESYDDPGANDDDYQPVLLDTNALAWLVSTSGSTGLPKVAAITHKVATKKCLEYMRKGMLGYGKLALNLAPVQWFTSYFNAVCYLLTDFVILQTSAPDTTDHIIDIINRYKPSLLFTSPTLPSLIMKQQKSCDWTCFDSLILAGSKPYPETIVELKKRLRPGVPPVEAYGQTEAVGAVLLPSEACPLGSCWRPIPSMPVKLVDPETEREITEPHIPGELWVKGEFFAGYYNDPEATSKSYSPDGWLKTGDLFYRGENDNYFIVDRIKMVIKYKGYQIVPPEVEGVIMRHPSVLETAVTGIPHEVDGQRAAALVVKKPGESLTEKEVDDFVASNLSDKKRLRGGIAFVDEIPKTSTGKIAREKLRKLSLTLLGGGSILN